jgi:hypothetical protein
LAFLLLGRGGGGVLQHHRLRSMFGERGRRPYKKTEERVPATIPSMGLGMSKQARMVAVFWWWQKGRVMKRAIY